MLCHSEVRLFINNITRTLFNFSSFCLNQIQPSVAFHIQTSHLICYVNQMTDFYMKCITRLPWVNRTYLCIPPQDFLENLQNCCILSSILESAARGVFTIFTKFLRRHLYHSQPQPATLSKERLWHRCFPENLVKFLNTPFFQNTSGGCLWRTAYLLLPVLFLQLTFCYSF